MRFGSLDECSRRLADAVSKRPGPIFVFPAQTVAWGYLFQRPQQMARALASLGATVIYFADADFPGRPDRLVRSPVKLDNGVILFADGRDGRSLASLGRPVVCWQYWPHQRTFIDNLPPDSVRIYDCLDSLEAFYPYPQMHADHAEALHNADIVTATSDALLQAARRIRPDAIFVPNAAWPQDFADNGDSTPAKLSSLRSNADIVVGYYGALADWIDWPLLEQVAALRPG